MTTKHRGEGYAAGTAGYVGRHRDTYDQTEQKLRDLAQKPASDKGSKSK